MTLYVDHARNKYGRMLMNHLIADSTSELHDATIQLGLKPEYIHHPGTAEEHLDISESKRLEAIQLGAVPVTSRDIVRMIQKKRQLIGEL